MGGMKCNKLLAFVLLRFMMISWVRFGRGTLAWHSFDMKFLSNENERKMMIWRCVIIMVRVQSGPPPPPPVPTTVLDIPPPVSGAERNPEFRNSAERENSAMREAIAKNNAVFKQNIRLLNEMHVKLLKMDQVNDGVRFCMQRWARGWAWPRLTLPSTF